MYLQFRYKKPTLLVYYYLLPIKLLSSYPIGTFFFLRYGKNNYFTNRFMYSSTPLFLSNTFILFLFNFIE